jgi:hypothetical protein
MGELVPLLALSIPVIVVLGKFVVEPLSRAIMKAVERDRGSQELAPLAERLIATEERLERMERSLTRLLEEQEFRRELQSSQRSSRPSDEGS